MFNGILKPYKRLKIIIPLMALLIIAIILIYTTWGGEYNYNKVSDTDIIKNYVKAIDEHDWDNITYLRPSKELEKWQHFFTSEDNRLNNVGLFDIDTAELKNIVSLTEDEVGAGTDIYKYNETYDNSVRGYLVGINLAVNKESESFYNGVNYILMVLATEDNTTKIIEFSQPSLWLMDHLVETQKLDEDENVKKAINMIKARYKGLILDSKGNVIDTI